MQSQGTILSTKHVIRIFPCHLLCMVNLKLLKLDQTIPPYLTNDDSTIIHHSMQQYGCQLPTVCAGKSLGHSHYFMAYYSRITTTMSLSFCTTTFSEKLHKPDSHPYLSQMTASYYVSRQMLEPPPLQLHKQTVSCYGMWLRQVSMIHYLPGPCPSFPLPSSPTSLFGTIRGMSGLADWHSHSLTRVHSINIQIGFHHPVLQNNVSVAQQWVAESCGLI